MANKLLMHYGHQMATGWFMQTLYSLLYVDLGLLFQPLQEQYDKYRYLVTHSWVKMFWKKLSMFNMHMIVADQPLEFPRKRRPIHHAGTYQSRIHQQGTKLLE